MTTEQHEALAASVEAGLREMFVGADALESRPQASGFRRVWVLTPKGVEPHILATLTCSNGADAATLDLRVHYGDASAKITSVATTRHNDPHGHLNIERTLPNHIRVRGFAIHPEAKIALRNSLRPESRAAAEFVTRFGGPLGPRPAPQPHAITEPRNIFDDRWRESGRPAPPNEDAVRQAVQRAFDADVKRRDDAVARALWAGATDSEREALREQLSDDLRSGRVTADEARASFDPDRIKAAEEANTIKAVLWSLPDAGDAERDRKWSDWCDIQTRAANRLWSFAPTPNPDADVVPDLGVPSTMGHLTAMGKRPLITTDEGPRSGWGTYDDD